MFVFLILFLFCLFSFKDSSGFSDSKCSSVHPVKLVSVSVSKCHQIVIKKRDSFFGYLFFLDAICIMGFSVKGCQDTSKWRRYLNKYKVLIWAATVLHTEHPTISQANFQRIYECWEWREKLSRKLTSWIADIYSDSDVCERILVWSVCEAFIVLF